MMATTRASWSQGRREERSTSRRMRHAVEAVAGAAGGRYAPHHRLVVQYVATTSAVFPSFTSENSFLFVKDDRRASELQVYSFPPQNLARTIGICAVISSTALEGLARARQTKRG